MRDVSTSLDMTRLQDRQSSQPAFVPPSRDYGAAKKDMNKHKDHRNEQSSRSSPSVNVSFSRTKQTISSRSESQARDQILRPRRCFTHACSETRCKVSVPVSTSMLIRFSRRSKKASS